MDATKQSKHVYDLLLPLPPVWPSSAFNEGTQYVCTLTGPAEGLKYERQSEQYTIDNYTKRAD